MSRDLKNEDLFADTTMTFGEHLEELRTCLFRSLIGVVIAFILVLLMGWPQAAVKFIGEPLERALTQFYLEQSRDHIKVQLDQLEADGAKVPDVEVVVDAIDKDSLLPELRFIDPRSAVTDLSNLYSVDALTNFPPVAVADILNAPQLSRQILEQSKQDDASPGKRIWSLLKPEDQELIQSVAAADAANAKEKAELAKALSAVMADKDFYQEAAFKEIADTSYSTPITAEQRLAEERNSKLKAAVDHRKQLKPAEFNRRLLAAAYPNSFAAGVRRVNMVPLITWKNVNDDQRIRLKSLSPHEMFMIYVKAAIVISLVVAAPWVFIQVWSFVAAGLYPHEKKYVHFFLPFSLVLFLAGVCVAFFFVFRFVLEFLFMFNSWMDIDPDMRISEWFGFALFLPLGFGVAFQLPLVMLFLERIGVFEVPDYLAKWKVAVLVMAIVSMLLTPADPWSMLAMLVPLTLLYFLGIGLCKWLPKNQNPFDEPA